MQQPTEVEYFDPARDWPKPIAFHASFSVVMEEMAFLGDTRSRCELLVFAQANPARLPLTMGILQPNIPVRKMMSERRTKLTDALVRVLCRLLTPIGVAIPGPHDEYMRNSLLPLAAHGDGHVLTVAVALLLAIRVFGAGKTRSLAVLLIALSCELSDFYAIVYTKENVAFFSPPVWPIRTRLGPYNCVSSEKQECTRTRVVQKFWQIITKPTTNKKQQNHHNQKRPANPPARFAFRHKAKQRSNKERGRAQQNKKRIQICLRYSDLSHRIILKNMQTNYPLRQCVKYST